MLAFFLNHSTAPVALGGAERSLFSFVERWRESDPELETFFITKHPVGQAIAELDRRGWDYEAIPFRGWADASPEASAAQTAYFATVDYAAVQRCIQLMEERRPDLVVTNTLVAPWAAFAAAALGIPHVWFVREFGDADHGMRFQTSRDETYADIGALSQLVVASSNALAKKLGRFVPSDKLTVLYPRVDGDHVRKAAQEGLGIDPFPGENPGLRIVVTGRLSVSKGQWRVIDAVARLREQGLETTLCLVGSAPSKSYERELRERARLLGIADRVVFAGELANPYAPAARADVAMMPSASEAFGRVTLEHMHLGKPVIANRSGGSVELVVHDETGMLIDVTDIDQIVDALSRYAQDSALVARHGASALARADSFVASDDEPLRARITQLAGTPAPRLPYVSRIWFDLPRLVHENSSPDRLFLSFLAARVARAAIRVLRLPRS